MVIVQKRWPVLLSPENAMAYVLLQKTTLNALKHASSVAVFHIYAFSVLEAFWQLKRLENESPKHHKSTKNAIDFQVCARVSFSHGFGLILVAFRVENRTKTSDTDFQNFLDRFS